MIYFLSSLIYFESFYNSSPCRCASKSESTLFPHFSCYFLTLSNYSIIYSRYFWSLLILASRSSKFVFNSVIISANSGFCYWSCKLSFSNCSYACLDFYNILLSSTFLKVPNLIYDSNSRILAWSIPSWSLSLLILFLFSSSLKSLTLKSPFKSAF